MGIHDVSVDKAPPLMLTLEEQAASHRLLPL